MKGFKPQRKVEAILVLIQIVVALAPLAANQGAVTAASSPEVGMEIGYTIQVRDGGLVVVNASIGLRNDGAGDISSLMIGFSKSFEQNLDRVAAYENEELDVVREGVKGDLFWVDVGFAEAVEQGQTLNLSVLFAFSGLVTPNQLSQGAYTVSFPAAPTLPFDVARCVVKVGLPAGVTVQGSSLGGVTEELWAPLKAYTSQVGRISFTGDIRILECDRAASEVVLDAWGNLKFLDSYSLRNVGRASTSSAVLRLPLDAEEVSAYDAGGPLGVKVKDVGGAKEVTVSLRYPLRGGEGAAVYYDACSFTVAYRVNSHLYVISTGPFPRFRLSFKLPAHLDLTLKDLVVKVTLPEGARYLTASQTGDISMKGLTPTIEYALTEVIPVQVSTLTVDYEYLTFWAALRPTLWVGGIAALISVLAFRRRRREELSLAVPEKNVRLVRSFTDICDERVIIWSEIDSLEETLDGGGIGRKDYNRRKRIVQQRLRALDDAFSGLKNEVRQLGPRYAALVGRLEKAEAEVSAIRGNVERFRAQYRSGRLSRRAFRELKNSHEKRAEGPKRTIESIIIELKGEI